MGITNAQLAAAINDLIDHWQGRQDEFHKWLSGPAGGGDGSDGRYPLTDYFGETVLVKSPAQLEEDVESIVSGALAYKNAAEVAALAAANSASLAGDQAGYADVARTASEAAQVAAEAAQSAAEDARNVAIAQANKAVQYGTDAQTYAEIAEESADVAVSSASAAAQDAASAAASAAAAALFDPSLYYPKVGTYADLRALEPQYLQPDWAVYVEGRDTTGDGGQGTFRWVPQDCSTEVAEDVMSGVWVAPDDDPTGASGAWKRDHDNVFDPRWFGCKGDDDTDDNPQFHDDGVTWRLRHERPLQAAADYAAAKRAILDFKGLTYKVSFSVVVPSYSHWRGPGAIHSVNNTQSIRGSCIHLGTWHPGYFDDYTAYSLEGTLAEGAVEFTFSNPGDASNFEVGDFVIIRSKAGVSGPNVPFHPEFAQINQVTEVDTVNGTIKVLDAALRGGFEFEIHHAEGDGVNDSALRYEMSVCAYAQVDGISLYSDNYHTLERGGCWHSKFYFPETRAMNVLASNMLQSSQIHIGFAEFSRVLNETAGNSLNMDIRIDEAIYRKTALSAARPLIVARERCTFCRFDFNIIRADEFDYTNALLNLGSIGCSIRIGSLYARKASNIIVQFNSGGAAPAPVGDAELLVPTCNDNEVTIEMAHLGSVQGIVYFDPSVHEDWGIAPGEHIYRNHIKMIRVARGATVSNYTALMNGVNNVIEDFYSEDGSVRMGAYARNCRVRGHHGRGIVVLPGGERNDVRISSNTWAAFSEATRVTQTGNGTQVSSTTPGNSVFSMAIPAGLLQTQDKIHYVIRGLIQGTNGEKFIRLRLNDTTNAPALTIPAEQAGYFAMDVMVSVNTGGSTSSILKVYTDFRGDVDPTGSRRVGATVDLVNDDLVLDLQAWVEDSSDRVIFDVLDVTPTRLFHG